MTYPVTVIGVGPGSREYLLPVAEDAVRQAGVLVGGKNALSLFAGLHKEEFPIGGDLARVLDFIEANRERRVAVLLSGDPGFFSFLPRLRERFGVENLRVIPGISSLQLACARLGLSWYRFRAVSAHGRGTAELAAARGWDRVAVLTDPRFTPAEVCRYFWKWNCDFKWVAVLTDLGLPGETVTLTSLEEGSQMEGRGYSIVLLMREEPGRETAATAGMSDKAPLAGPPAPEPWSGVVTPGLPNRAFARGKAALSQEEARALVICKARLRQGMTVIEIGAGTGAWTVEVGRLIAPGEIWAVEREPGAAQLVRENVRRFGLDNVHLVEGEAPQACQGFPVADCVLVGGSGGNLQDILEAAGGWLRPGGTLVLSAVTPDTCASAWELLQGEGWCLDETVMINVARVEPRGKARIWRGENPIFILRALRAGKGR